VRGVAYGVSVILRLSSEASNAQDLMTAAGVCVACTGPEHGLWPSQDDGGAGS
jgi:hypothetical protein